MHNVWYTVTSDNCASRTLNASLRCSSTSSRNSPSFTKHDGNVCSYSFIRWRVINFTLFFWKSYSNIKLQVWCQHWIRCCKSKVHIMVYTLTSCLDLFVTSHASSLFYFEGFLLCVLLAFHFLSLLVFPSILIVCPTLIGYTCVLYFLLSVPWLPCYNVASPDIICTASVFLESSWSFLCSFLHFAWFWILDFYLCAAGFVCLFMDSFPGFDPHLPYKWWVEYWSEPSLPVMSVNISPFVVFLAGNMAAQWLIALLTWL